MKQQARQHKRHKDGSLDIEHYVKQGRILRAGFFTAMCIKGWQVKPHPEPYDEADEDRPAVK